MTNPTPPRNRSSSSEQFATKQSPAKELAIFRNSVSRLTQNPTKLRAIAVKAGIATPSGKLKKAYGG